MATLKGSSAVSVALTAVCLLINSFVTPQGLPKSQEDLYGIWEGTRTNTGYFLQSDTGKWEAGCFEDVARVLRTRKTSVSFLNEDSKSSAYKVSLEIGGFESDILWTYETPYELTSSGWTFHGGVEKFLSTWNASSDNYDSVKSTTEYFTNAEVSVGDGPSSGCQRWSLRFNKQNKTVEMTVFEVVKVSVYMDGSASFEDTSCPNITQKEAFCDDSRVAKSDREQVRKKEEAAEAVQVKRDSEGRVIYNKGGFGYCLEATEISTTPTDNYAEQLGNLPKGATEAGACGVYLYNGLAPVFKTIGTSSDTVRSCFDIREGWSQGQTVQMSLDCIKQFRAYFSQNTGNEAEKRLMFCQTYGTCYTCDFCIPYLNATCTQCEAMVQPDVVGNATAPVIAPGIVRAPTPPMVPGTVRAPTPPIAPPVAAGRRPATTTDTPVEDSEQEADPETLPTPPSDPGQGPRPWKTGADVDAAVQPPPGLMAPWKGPPPPPAVVLTPDNQDLKSNSFIASWDKAGRRKLQEGTYTITVGLKTTLVCTAGLCMNLGA